MKKIEVSVAMATFNGEAYLREQIDSILIQLDETDELVISDDGSNDHTVSIIESYLQDSRVKFIQNDKKKGFVGNFENAIKATNNPIVLLSDQDDIWSPKKVAIIREEFSQNPRAHLLIHNACMVDSQGNCLKESFDSLRTYRSGFWKNLWKNKFTGCCMAFSIELSGIFLPFPDKISFHDIWIGLMSHVMQIPIVYIDEPLIQHRRHLQTATTVSSRTMCQKWLIRYTILKSIILRRYNMD